METSLEPLELSNVSISGIELPKIDRDVTAFMLCYDSIISFTRSETSDPKCSKYFFKSYDRPLSVVVDDNIGGDYDIDIGRNTFGKKYLSIEGFHKNHDVDFLLSKMGDKKPNYFMKIKNPEFDKFIALPNGQSVMFNKNVLTRYDDRHRYMLDNKGLVNSLSSLNIDNVYLDQDNVDEMVGIVFNKIDSTELANEYWIAFHYEQSSMVKNA